MCDETHATTTASDSPPLPPPAVSNPPASQGLRERVRAKMACLDDEQMIPCVYWLREVFRANLVGLGR